MGDVPVLKPREVAGILERIGFVEVRQAGRTGSTVTRTAVRPQFHSTPAGTFADTATGDRARHRNGRPRLRRASLRKYLTILPFSGGAKPHPLQRLVGQTSREPRIQENKLCDVGVIGLKLDLVWMIPRWVTAAIPQI